jgi:hypothetical protein
MEEAFHWFYGAYHKVFYARRTDLHLITKNIIPLNADARIQDSRSIGI